MKVTSEQVISEMKKGLEGVDPTNVRTVRMVVHPEAELLAQSLAPEVLVDLFGGCGNILYTVTTLGPTEGKIVNVKVFYKGPTPTGLQEADAAIKSATSSQTARKLLDELKQTRAEKAEAESILKLIHQCTPAEGDSQEVVLAKLAGIPKIVDKALKIKTDNPKLWQMFLDQMPEEGLQDLPTLKKGLTIGIETARKLLILLD